jgi:3-phosphoshikimate 1-carboxyvinyltransferase
MALVIAGLVADGKTVLHDAECIADSFPGFSDILRSFGAGVERAVG